MTSPERQQDDLRREIDEVDAAIHDLLLRRTELVAKAGAMVHPGHEARSLRRLIARHRGPFPKRILVRIWREIVSALAALDAPLAVAAFAPEQGVDLRGLARDHFGSESPISACETSTSVLRQVTERQATVGVLPLPRDGESDPWWRHLARATTPVPRIVGRLPFAALEPARAVDTDGLVVALSGPSDGAAKAPRTRVQGFEDSGSDHSFLIVETGEQLSRSRLADLLGTARLTPVNIQAWKDQSDVGLHLVEVEGHVAAGDSRLADLLEAGEDGGLSQVWAIGGYPVPLTPVQLAEPSLAEVH